MKILKFGGSSVATPDRIRGVAEILLRSSRRERTAVVVSAFQGVTNQLLECARAASAGDSGYVRILKTLGERHGAALRDLHDGRPPKPIREALNGMLGELRDVMHGVSLLRDCPPRALDLAASFGERLSALIISSYIGRRQRSLFLDTREVIVTDDHFTQAAVLFDQTNRSIKARFSTIPRRTVPIVTGFIASTEDGRTTTIGRNGSDYSAAILGGALNASVIEIWTDVDGVYSADPRVVSSAFVLPQLSYEEAMELSYFGAKVLHASTIAPAVSKGIPILIKNTMNPSAPGTLIAGKAERLEDAAKGISAMDEMTLLTLRGMSMVGIPGTAERLFRSLASSQVNIILISQASSEHTICLAINTRDDTRARKAIQHEFRYELQHGLTALDEKPAQTIVAVVGEGMKGTPGVAGKIFQSLGQNAVNINAIAQGASERNISLVVDSASAPRAVNVIHQAFFEKRKRLGLIVIGTGNIGSTLLKQIGDQQGVLFARGYDVHVCGVSNSKRFAVRREGIDLTRWREVLDHSGSRFTPEELARSVSDLDLVNVALIDCTASPDIVEAYPLFIRANTHVITPNKKANVLPWKKYRALMDLLQERQKHFLYEANVGAGLPIISTLQDLIASGDEIVRIDGILSGTLSYLFSRFSGKEPFSELVRDAHRKGYTEPDPRDDLSGMDVARKLLILARQLGWRMELGDIAVENLIPPALRRGDFSDKFYGRYSGSDSSMERRLRKAGANGNALRYVGTLEKGKAHAGVREVPRSHPIAMTKGSDNIIAFTTKRYCETPLVVQGPGAGADVTAMGVFSDILKLLHYLPY